jgi:hypothetical protein
VTPRRRSTASAFSIDPPGSDDRAFRCSLADEVAIDLPSARAALDCLRRDHVEADAVPSVAADVALSSDQAAAGATVELAIRLRHTCDGCGGRGEYWGDRCHDCRGSGHAIRAQRLELHVPAGIEDGDGFTFFVTPIHGPRTRVVVRIVVGA